MADIDEEDEEARHRKTVSFLKQSEVTMKTIIAGDDVHE